MKELQIVTKTTYKTAATNRYFNELRSEVLTPKEEFDLFLKVKDGDEAALDKIIKCNLRFVVSVAKQYASNGNADLLLDLIQEGNIGLMKATKTFDPYTGFKFITYAVWVIRQAIMKYLEIGNKTVKTSLNFETDRSKLRKVFTKLEGQLERTPTNDEAVEEFERMYNSKMQDPISRERIEEKVIIFNTGFYISSLDKVVSDDSTTPMYETMADESSYEIENNINQDYNVIVSKRLLKCLTTREREVLELMYGLDGGAASKDRAVEKFGLSTERIRQISMRGILKMKHEARKLCLA